MTQGNDTDSYGATAGSILGAYFGPEGLDDRWLASFNDDLRTGLVRFYERSLATVARRMGSLPGQVSKEIIRTKPTRVQQSSQDTIKA